MFINFIVNFHANVSNFMINHYKKYKNEFEKYEKIRQKFIKDFPIEKITSLTLEKFTIGNKNTKSFCSRLENELKILGDMHGSYVNKFGVYYSNKRERFECTKKWDKNKNIEKSFINLKKEIFKLLKDGNKNNFKGIQKNEISPLFKGKLLATYFPEKYLPIFSIAHIKHFLDLFNLKYDKNLTIEENKNKFLEIKKYDERLKILDNNLLIKFVYEYHVDFIFNSFDFKKYYRTKFNPQIVDLDYIGINQNKTFDKKPFSKIDYQYINFQKEKQGMLAEKIVIENEKKKLRNIGRKDLADKVEHSSLIKGDGLGYDVRSYDKDGNIIYIEVKSKNIFKNTVEFYLTDNELKFLENNDNCFIYFVYDIRKDCKIHITDLKKIKKIGENIISPVMYKIAIDVINHKNNNSN